MPTTWGEVSCGPTWAVQDELGRGAQMVHAPAEENSSETVCAQETGRELSEELIPSMATQIPQARAQGSSFETICGVRSYGKGPADPWCWEHHSWKGERARYPDGHRGGGLGYSRRAPSLPSACCNNLNEQF